MGYSDPWLAASMMWMDRRLRGLAFGWLIYAGLVCLGGLMGLAFAHAWMHGGHWDGSGYGHRFWHGPTFPLLAWRFARVALLCKVGLAVAAGIGLLHRARWGRSVAILAAVFALLSFPFGTALGIWTLVVLLNRQNAAAYDAIAT